MPRKTLKRMANRFGRNTLPDPLANIDFRAKLTETQYYYIKAKSLLEKKEVQVVVRELIMKAYENEKKYGVDIVAIAIDNGIL